MAKNKQSIPQPPTTTEPQLRKTVHAYRIEKISQFEYQAYKIVLLDDGTYAEEKFDRLTLPDLLGRRMFMAMGREAHEVFEANKKIKAAAAAAIKELEAKT